MSPQSIEDIASYHAHIYYDPLRSRGEAQGLRAQIAERFAVRLGRWHDAPVGPHARAMFQVAFAPEVFAALTPWLMLNHGSLSILIHPNTTAPRADHLDHALWLGPPLAVKAEVLPEAAEAEEPGAVNTTPYLAP